MLSEIIHQPEGRRLEFKSQLPSAADIAKTIVAFSNDAGGELFIGIQDNPRELKGLLENELFQQRL
jgi:ATP-dependent DNA helicase RecG